MLVSQLYGPRASVRAPSREDSLEETRGYFQKGPWTFFVAPSEIFDVEKHFPGHEAFYLRHAARFSWASIEHCATPCLLHVLPTRTPCGGYGMKHA
jgi:hypothetical protein